MSKGKEESRLKDVAEIVRNPENNKKYLRGRFLGKGGFARCFELTDMDTQQIFAGKIVSKQMISKTNQKEKIAQEIDIHRELNHKHVVKFFGFFEDKENVYILLELCPRRSLMEMHKRRRNLTERETRYFIQQIAIGCIYLHDKNIIHRDLKLGNLFLNENMQIKLGDFGLATRVTNNERKKTLCGTPNYIAPEILSKKGHSFEVDVWSLGCIMYTLLAGRPPFETSSLKETYHLIRRNEYHVPSKISGSARTLIKKMLHPDPAQRPTMKDILRDEFICTGPPVPSRLPTSCLSTIPRMDDSIWQAVSVAENPGRRPLSTLNKPTAVISPKGFGGRHLPMAPPHSTATNKENADENEIPVDCFASNINAMLESLIRSKPCDVPNVNEEDALDPAAIPIFWVSKWVDYTDKYGLGYQLCDNSVGVLFNDNTRIVQLADGQNIHYIEQNGNEHYHTLTNHPETMKKKVTLLHYFISYMQEHLLKMGDTMAPREGDELIRLPYLKAWFRTRNAIVMHLTNGTLQLNFFQDHTKIILCPLMGAVTYINEKKEFFTYRIKKLEQHGCGKELFSRLRYAKAMTEKILTSAGEK